MTFSTRYSNREEKTSAISINRWMTNGYDLELVVSICTQNRANTTTFAMKVSTSSRISCFPLMKTSFLTTSLFSEGLPRRYSTSALWLELSKLVYLSQWEVRGERRVRIVKDLRMELMLPSMLPLCICTLNTNVTNVCDRWGKRAARARYTSSFDTAPRRRRCSLSPSEPAPPPSL